MIIDNSMGGRIAKIHKLLLKVLNYEKYKNLVSKPSRTTIKFVN